MTTRLTAHDQTSTMSAPRHDRECLFENLTLMRSAVSHMFGGVTSGRCYELHSIDGNHHSRDTALKRKE